MTEPILWALAVAQFAGLIALAALLIISRRRLRTARRQLDRSRRDQAGPRRRRRRGLAPFAIRKTWQTAEMLRDKGIGATMRNSIEDLAGWAQVERPDLARLTADGDVVIVFSDIEASTKLNEALGDRDWVKLPPPTRPAHPHTRQQLRRACGQNPRRRIHARLRKTPRSFALLC